MPDSLLRLQPPMGISMFSNTITNIFTFVDKSHLPVPSLKLQPSSRFLNNITLKPSIYKL